MSTPKILQNIRNLMTKQSSMESSISTMSNSIVDNNKYHIPTVSRIDNSASSDAIISLNPIPTTWNSISDYKFSNNGYIIESSLSPTSSTSLTSIFDGNGSTYGYFSIPSYEKENFYIYITLPTAISIRDISLYIVNHANLREVYIEGRDSDTDDWTTLKSDLNHGRFSSSTIENSDYYNYYRLGFILDGETTLQIHNVDISSYAIKIIENQFILPNITDTLEVNQIVRIKTPDYDPTGITVNKLGSNTSNLKNIDALLLPNRFYELIYNGSIYLAKEVV